MEVLSPPLRRLVNALMLYKSVFAGPWFEALSKEEAPERKEIYDRIMRETSAQARMAFDLLHRWDGMSEEGRAQRVTNKVLERLLDDMLSLKKSSTEVFLSAGIDSPTEEMRREFLELADIDRKHAEALRAALGIRLPNDPSSATHGFAGVHSGPFPPGTITRTIKGALEQARTAGHEPIRIILSSMALRHLRDEGSVLPRQGNIFGLPADIDFSWEREAFSIVSRARVSLSEIVTEMEAGERPIAGKLGLQEPERAKSEPERANTSANKRGANKKAPAKKPTKTAKGSGKAGSKKARKK